VHPVEPGSAAGRATDAPAAAPGAIHHLELYVSDLERSARFWGWLLAQFGYEPFQEWDDGISFRTASTYLVFVEAPDDSRQLDRRAAGLNHLAFSLPSTDLVDDLRTDLAARGVRLLYDDRYPHAGGSDHYAVFFEDPDGLKVEVVATAIASSSG
jgi:catechol 2,3-dioxygenase-like lactoylglutathione lyase family enzyme